MNQLKSIVCILCFIASLLLASAEAPKLEESWLSKSLSSEGNLILQDQDGYRVWGCSAVYDDEGKVHVYFAIIPDKGHWLRNGEIGHAVADKPEGPYKVQGSILQGRGPGYWDASSIHNPSIYRVVGKYVLLYIGNDISKAETWRDRAQEAGSQRVGMAIADNPYGPWKRFDRPIIDVSNNPDDWDEYCVVNPAFVKHPNGQYWIYYRAWDRNHDDRRKTGVAFADSLEGPYLKYEGNPVIDKFEGVNGQTEDPTLFYWNGKFHCVIRDMGNWDWLSSLYLSSEDGLNWSYPKRAKHQGATYYPMRDDKRCERDQILLKDGKPDYLFNAVQRPEGNCGGVVKINLSE
ncbi:glycoside hydrolase family protein [Pelagicoccus mobilis]|uniref:Glycoside hydrolase family protein n=1 Tax=Pelagicoccus mobilis TaxID=415221 RepID=A0A934VSI9_9BACT|nr:glycoside hydrolase family protein [Pelagicoccus mobilis]MBK1879065.1 glycoside hydrolase family protein [Pelagicoccus mobilis]